MNDVVLLGCRGFVGSAFARHLSQQGISFLGVEAGNYGEGAGPCRLLIDAAGNSRKYLAEEDPLADFELTVSLVMRTLLDYPAEHFVLISSVDVYPNLDSPESTREDTPIDPLASSAYGFHKLMAELCVRRHARRWSIFRLAGMVGPGLRKNPVFDILHQAPLRIHPDSRYQYMHTDDVASTVWQLIRDGAPGEIWNVCGEGLISPAEIAKLAGRRLDLSILPSDSKPRVVDVNLAKTGGRIGLPSTVATIDGYVRQALSSRSRQGGQP